MPRGVRAAAVVPHDRRLQVAQVLRAVEGERVHRATGKGAGARGLRQQHAAAAGGAGAGELQEHARVGAGAPARI